MTAWTPGRPSFTIKRPYELKYAVVFVKKPM